VAKHSLYNHFVVFNVVAALSLGAVSFSYSSISYADVSAAQYVAKMVQHRSRLQKGMLLAFHKFRPHFAHLNEKVIKDYSDLHDRPKEMTLAELQKWGYVLTEDIATILGRYYGKDKSELSYQDSLNLEIAISELNRIEQEIKDVFFAEFNQAYYGVTNMTDTQAQLETLEHWVDIIDTRLSRRDELNIAGPIENDAANYLESVEKAPPLAIYIAMYLGPFLSPKLATKCQRLISPESKPLPTIK
jgi:hypothetical protein